MTASGTRIDMAAQRRCPETGNGPQDSQALKAQPSPILIHETVVVRANDIGHLTAGRLIPACSASGAVAH